MQETPELNFQNMDEEIFNSIFAESIFVIKVFVMKHKIEVPVLYIKNMVLSYDKPSTAQLDNLTLYVFKDNGETEVFEKELYDLGELKSKYKFILVIYNALKMIKEDTDIDNSEYNPLHVKMFYFKKK